MRRLATAIAVTLYVALGVWVGYFVARPADPSEDMSAYKTDWDVTLVLVYVVGAILLVRFAKRGHTLRSATVPLLVVPAWVAAFRSARSGMHVSGAWHLVVSKCLAPRGLEVPGTSGA